MAIRRGAHIPAGTAAIARHLFDAATFQLGREQVTVPGTERHIGLSSAERCIADAFRLRGGVGYELARARRRSGCAVVASLPG